MARRIMAKAVEIGEGESGPILDRHFTYLRMIQVYYSDRGRDADALPLAIDACQRQIALGLKEETKGQGWNGDWDKRIARCAKKLR